MTGTDQYDATLDRIERTIDIDATAERVWSLVQRPGWWINEHDVDPDPVITWEEEDTAVVVHEKFGEFRLVRLESDPPRYICYRWLESPEAGTRVEFWIEDRPGGVRLRVVESGLTGLGKDPAALRQHHEGNSHGWEQELQAARRFVLGSSA